MTTSDRTGADRPELINPAMTLGALVTAHPELAGELERRGLDYCCGGQQPLGDACRDRGLDTAATIVALGSAVSADREPAPWSSMDAGELVRHLVATHHRYLWDEMPRLSALLTKILTVHGERHPELQTIETCFSEIRADLEPHLLKEERVLFPMIAELSTASAAPAFHCGTLGNPIAVMLQEHDAVGGLLARLRRLTNGYRTPPDGCASYSACFSGLAELEADTHLHIHKENNVLFPMVARLEQELAGARQ